ncbi:MAG: helix-turn-helix transcriptional regulator [Bacteroides stercoris]
METNLSAFEILGDSMDDGTRRSFAPGDELIVEPFNINDFKDSIGSDLGSFWVIQVGTCILVRQIVEYANDTIKCHSLNPNGQYPDVLIKIEDITKIYRVIQKQEKAVHYGL